MMTESVMSMSIPSKALLIDSILINAHLDLDPWLICNCFHWSSERYEANVSNPLNNCLGWSVVDWSSTPFQCWSMSEPRLFTTSSFRAHDSGIYWRRGSFTIKLSGILSWMEEKMGTLNKPYLIKYWKLIVFIHESIL